MPTLAAIFPPTQAPERLGAVAAAAEASGLPELWVWEDCFSESGIATATAILAATSHVRVGIGLLPVPLRNVALTAMEIATVARLFPGRLVAGVGHGVLDWMSQVGAGVSSPLTLLREYTAALHALLHGEAVTTPRPLCPPRGCCAGLAPFVVPPLLVGGIGPRTVGLAGELADGLILPGGLSPDDVRAALGHFHRDRTARPPGPHRGLHQRPGRKHCGRYRGRRRRLRPRGSDLRRGQRHRQRHLTSSGSSGSWPWKWLPWCRDRPACVSCGP